MVNHDCMRAYSEDLRKIGQAVERGMPKAQAGRLFGVSISFGQTLRQTCPRGTLPGTQKGRRRPPKADEATRKLLEEDIEKRPAATIAERRRFVEDLTGNSLSEPTLRRLLKRMGFSRKKGLWGRWNETSS